MRPHIGKVLLEGVNPTQPVKSHASDHIFFVNRFAHDLRNFDLQRDSASAIKCVCLKLHRTAMRPERVTHRIVDLLVGQRTVASARPGTSAY